MKTLVLLGVVMASTAMAQAISGTLSATYLNSDQGIPQVQVDVNLSCSLTCDSSAPVKHFAFAGGINSKYASAPTESAGYQALLATDLDLDGQASATSNSFKPGQTVLLEGTSATCHCGNRAGEGGFVDLVSPNVVIPALIGTETRVRVGDEVGFFAFADLRGAEQVELKAEGGGLSQSRTFGVSDLDSQGTALYLITFTTPGTATVTATLRPSGVASTATWTVVARAGATGGGGGSSGTGGGSGGGGDPTAPEGCNAIGGPLLVGLALTLLRRRQ